MKITMPVKDNAKTISETEAGVIYTYIGIGEEGACRYKIFYLTPPGPKVVRFYSGAINTWDKDESWTREYNLEKKMFNPVKPGTTLTISV